MCAFFKSVKAGVLVAGDDFDVLAMVLKEMGAITKKIPSSCKLPRGVSHLLVDASLVTPELAVAAEGAKLPVVSPAWVHQSMAEGKMLSVSDFRVDLCSLKTTRAEARALLPSESAANAPGAAAAKVPPKQQNRSPTALEKRLSSIPDSSDALFHSSQRDEELTPSRTYAGRRRRGGTLKPTLSKGLKARRTKSSEAVSHQPSSADAPSLEAPPSPVSPEAATPPPISAAGQSGKDQAAAPPAAHQGERKAAVKPRPRARKQRSSQAAVELAVPGGNASARASGKPAAAAHPTAAAAKLHLLVSGCDDEIRQMAHVLLESAASSGLPALPPVGPAAALEHQHTSPVTHIVTDRPGKRTQKLLRALACGAWILKPSWVLASLSGDSEGGGGGASAGARVTARSLGIPWAEEAPHRWEAKSCPAARRKIGARGNTIFEGMVFLVAGLNTRSKRKPDPSSNEVRDILLKAGAESVDIMVGRQRSTAPSSWPRPGVRQHFVLQGGQGLSPAARSACAKMSSSFEQGHIAVLPLDWAWDCLWNGAVVDIEDATLAHFRRPAAATFPSQAPVETNKAAASTTAVKHGIQMPTSASAASASGAPPTAGTAVGQLRQKRRREAAAASEVTPPVTPQASVSDSTLSASAHARTAQRRKRSRRDSKQAGTEEGSSPSGHAAASSPSEAHAGNAKHDEDGAGAGADADADASQSSCGSDALPVAQVPAKRGSKRHRAPGIGAAASAAVRHAKRPRRTAAFLAAEPTAAPHTSSATPHPECGSSPRDSSPASTARPAIMPSVAVAAAPKQATPQPKRVAAKRPVATASVKSPLHLQRVSATEALMPQAVGGMNHSASTLSASGTPQKTQGVQIATEAAVSVSDGLLSVADVEGSEQQRRVAMSDDIEDSQGGGDSAPAAAIKAPVQTKQSAKSAQRIQGSTVPRATQINFQQPGRRPDPKPTTAGTSAGTYSCDTEQNTLSEASGGGSFPLAGARAAVAPLPLAAAAELVAAPQPKLARGLSQLDSATVSNSTVSIEGGQIPPVSTPVMSKQVSRGGTGRASLSAQSAPQWSPASSIAADGSQGHESVMSGVAFSLTGKEAESARKRSAVKVPQHGSDSKVSPPAHVNHAHGTAVETTAAAHAAPGVSKAEQLASPESVSKTLTFIAAAARGNDSQISDMGECAAATAAQSAGGGAVPKQDINEDSLSEGSQEW